jgi:hypothetical protein
MSQMIAWNVSTVLGQTLRVWNTDGTLLESQAGTPDENRPTRHAATFATNVAGTRECDVIRTSDSVVLWTGYVGMVGAGGSATAVDTPPQTVVVSGRGMNAQYSSSSLQISIGSLQSPTTDNTSTMQAVLALADGTPLTSGTVEATVQDSSGNALEGVTWPVPLTHIDDGLWQGAIIGDMKWPTSRIGQTQLRIVSGGSERTLTKPARFVT